MKPEVVVALLAVVVTVVGGSVKFFADRSLDRRLVQLGGTVADLSDGPARRAMQATVDEIALVVSIRLRAPRYLVFTAVGWVVYLAGVACILPSFLPELQVLWAWCVSEPPAALLDVVPPFVAFWIRMFFALPWMRAFFVLAILGYAVIGTVSLVKHNWMVRLYEKETGRRYLGATKRWLG